MKPIPYGKQQITAADIEAVVKTLQSDFLTQGPQVSQFEQDFAAYIGAKYAVAVTNGTAALHLATMALNVKPGQKVITTPITFAASANCIRYCGAEVVFADIDPATYLIDIDSVEQLLCSAAAGEYAGIIPVDFAGRAVDLEKLKQLADKYHLWIIEDACHAVGGFMSDSQQIQQKCGNGVYADIGIFSFHPVKHIATGEGGMITTNNEELYRKLCLYRTHGIVRDTTQFKNSIELVGGIDSYPAWYMEMQELGYNYRISDINCALGISQLKRIDTNLAKRRAIAQKYADFFVSKDYVLGQSGYVDGHAYHLYILQVPNRLGLYNYLRSKNIFTQIHYIPCHLMPYYRQQGYKPGDRPNAEKYYQHCISLPMYHSLSNEEQDYVLKTIDEFYRK